jgi:HAD superfamily hydrolase (TIGR01484 family)
MHYAALACDYDGTLANKGEVPPTVVGALQKLIRAGRKLILVTGRELSDLEMVFPSIKLCARVVAENGGVLSDPAAGTQKLLATRPPDSFAEALRRHGVSRVSTGQVIVATRSCYESQVHQAIQETGLKLEIILNKESLMVLPAGVDKGTGLTAALSEMGLEPGHVAGIGDAENDQAFLQLCGCSAAVENALPMLKEQVDFVTRGSRGDGVMELIENLLKDELRPCPH